jgi:hypothetical protein
LLLWGGDIVSNGFDQNIRDVGVAWKDDRVCPISSARCNITIRRFLAGPLTPASEPPPTSKADYPAYINLTPVANAPYARLDPLFIQGDELEMVIDFSAGTLKEKFTVVGGIAINSIRFTGTIDRSRNFPIRGTFTHIANNRVSGTFIGNFYGPQGREIGLLLQGQAEDGTPVIGYVVGYYWRPEP